MARSLIALGSNLGDRRALLEAALTELAETDHIRLQRASRLYETPPVGGPPGQNAYLNAAAVLDTSLEPAELLGTLQTIERKFGRIRHVHWGPRPIDLDLLLYENLILETPELIVPHPRLAVRRFVLEPAAEIAGDWLHPQFGWSLARLLAHARSAVPYLAITGAPGAGKTELARRIRQTGEVAWIEDPLDAAQLAAFYADPAGHAWDTEIEFLAKRTALLATDRWDERSGWTVSDFWIGQSPAFASVWLPPELLPAYRRQWQAARANVLGPKLLVVLDVPETTLIQRIASRGRAYEQRLDVETLGSIRHAIQGQAARSGQGPVLWLKDAPPEAWLEEVRAAMTAMQAGA